MKKLIIGIGIPGSGKTTVLKDFAKKWEYIYICPDDIRAEMTGDPSDQSKNKEVWDEARKRVQDHFQKGDTIVFDATLANQEQRKEFLAFARKNGAEKIEGIFLDIPLELAKERNEGRKRKVPEHVLEKMDESIRNFPPEIEDGLDALFTLDENQKLVETEMLKRGEIIQKEFGKLR